MTTSDIKMIANALRNSLRASERKHRPKHGDNWIHKKVKMDHGLVEAMAAVLEEHVDHVAPKKRSKRDLIPSSTNESPSQMS